MKKNLIRLLTAALGAACVLSFAACGGNSASTPEDNADASKASVSSAVSQAVSSAVDSVPASSAAEDDASSAAATGSYETVEDFFNSGVMDEELKSIEEQMATSGMDVDITAKGNQLTYTFTYQDTNGAEPEALGAVLKKMTNSMASAFEGVAAELAKAVKSDDASVVVTYVNEDGVELYSQEFFPAAE